MSNIKDDEILIAEKIIALRKHKNLSQKQLANYLKIDYSSYSYFECEKLPFDLTTIKLIAKLFNINFLSIVDDDIDLIAFINIIKG